MPRCVEATHSQLWRVDNHAEPFILADSPDTGDRQPATRAPNLRRH